MLSLMSVLPIRIFLSETGIIICYLLVFCGMRLRYSLLATLVLAGLLGAFIFTMVVPGEAYAEVRNASAGTVYADLIPLPLNPFAVAASSPAAPVENASDISSENGSLVPASGDDELALLMADSSLPLLMLSVQNIHAAYYRDEGALFELAPALYDLAFSTLQDAEACTVSPENESIKADFIAALEEYAAAGRMLADSGLRDPAEVETALDRIAVGTDRLHLVMASFNDTADVAPDEFLLQAEPSPMPTPAFPGALGLGERYCYDDSSGDNMLSLIVESTRRAHAFTVEDSSRKRIEAEPGREYLLVALKYTHLGYKGDGKNYLVRLPAARSFTLVYQESTYQAIDVPAMTSQGQSYLGGQLDRYEALEGFLFFEIPEAMNISEAYLKADLGVGKPIWRLMNLR